MRRPAITVMLGCLLGMVLAASAASARVASCGSVAPPLPPGTYEETSFYKVTAFRTSCHTARTVSLIWLKKIRVHRRIDGFACTELLHEPADLLMICRRRRATIRGYNGGD
jgi:hypothetical protein